ncbi:THAP domain-containing protein 2 [Merluccius polli]|uniref:THAP domain-containing protein 1 n=1 Tax=Merluccius polli TaxID=89951 RepID=A0AA47M4P3_MERPO|nr:THAP domain-containing protein 2 [Merluccius polli]
MKAEVKVECCAIVAEIIVQHMKFSSGFTMVGCAAFGCSNRSEKGVRMYGFPKDIDRRKRWLAMVSRQNFNIKGDNNNRKLCELHFEDNQFMESKSGTRKLRPDAVPTTFIHRPKPKRRKTPSRMMASAEVKTPDDHTYCTESNIGMIPVNTVFPQFFPFHGCSVGGINTYNTNNVVITDIEEAIEVQLEGSERDVPGDEAEVSRQPGASQSRAGVQVATLTGTGTSLPGTSVPGASHDRASVEDLLRELKKEKNMRIKAERALARQKKINLALRRRNNNFQQKFTSIFNRDQIRALSQKKKGVIRWGNETIKKAIQIRFTAGTTGYKTLQNMKIPLPDIRTVQRRMEHVKLKPGVLGEVFDMLKLKAGSMSQMERDCVLTLDEMAITPSVELHMGTGKLFGNVTLPGHNGRATHACVFMLAGVTTRWKQVVAYHYSSNSTDGAVYQPIIIAIVEAAASVGASCH